MMRLPNNRLLSRKKVLRRKGRQRVKARKARRGKVRKAKGWKRG
tara:strand:+ start:139 stop:270 length:132 start_codon:yes stop_codon:yes gene_type:complete